MLILKNTHLSYCSNIHPGESWKEVKESLRKHVPDLKKNITPDSPFGIGLRLSDLASKELLENNEIEEFKKWLAENNLYIFTFNGFPYGGFHRQVVKEDVHTPDWRTKERLAYTIRLCGILAELLPSGLDGGISTSPLSYKPWLKNSTDKEKAFEESTLHLAAVALRLYEIENKTGKYIHIDIEPEPDGLIENTSETIDFFTQWLDILGAKHLSEKLKISTQEAKKIIRRHIQVCYDVCHFAVEFENPRMVFQKLKEAEISIGKIQISAALKVLLSADLSKRNEVAEKLKPFVESTYLHQVVQRNTDGSIKQYSDLNLALPNIHDIKAEEWRTHFHVPIFLREYDYLCSTQEDIIEVLKLHQQSPVTTHLEVETYTWDVLPSGMKLDISASIEREMKWVLEQLKIE